MSSSAGPMHPGRILHEQAMEPLGVSRNKLARDIDVPVGRISDIVAGKRGITPDTALRLGKYFGTTAELWMKLQTEYDLAVARETTWPEVEPRVRELNHDDLMAELAIAEDLQEHAGLRDEAEETEFEADTGNEVDASAAADEEMEVSDDAALEPQETAEADVAAPDYGTEDDGAAADADAAPAAEDPIRAEDARRGEERTLSLRVTRQGTRVVAEDDAGDGDNADPVDAAAAAGGPYASVAPAPSTSPNSVGGAPAPASPFAFRRPPPPEQPLGLPEMPAPAAPDSQASKFSPAAWAARLNAATPHMDLPAASEPFEAQGLGADGVLDADADDGGIGSGGVSEDLDDFGEASGDGETLEIPEPDDWRDRLSQPAKAGGG